MNIREATRADNAALCALEARTPLNIGDRPLYIQRANFFETHEMQPRTVVMLAEEGGEILGVCAGALVEAPLAGRDRLLLYIHHERIAPEHQRKGIGGALTRAISDYWKARDAGHIDSSFWYIAEGNRQSRSFAERGGNFPWPKSVWMCSIPAPKGATEEPRRIGAGPTFDIVRLINATHAGEDLFGPYEQVDFGQRLSRSTGYGWGDVYGRFRDGRLVATAGLWKHTVADFGFEAGAEAEMSSLLASLAAARADGGSLTIFLDTESPLYRALTPPSPWAIELLFYAPRVEPEPGRRMYVDPVYF